MMQFEFWKLFFAVEFWHYHPHLFEVWFNQLLTVWPPPFATQLNKTASLQYKVQVNSVATVAYKPNISALKYHLRCYFTLYRKLSIYVSRHLDKDYIYVKCVAILWMIFACDRTWNCILNFTWCNTTLHCISETLHWVTLLKWCVECASRVNQASQTSSLHCLV